MFSRSTEYAMRVMAWLALTPEVLVPVSALAERTKVPEQYLSKVLGKLVASEMIVGRRGAGGGYRLRRPAEQITLLEIVRTFASLRRITECPLGLESHSAMLCPLHARADAACAAIINILGSSTLQDLISDSHSSTPLCDTAERVGLTVSGRSPTTPGSAEGPTESNR
jgi:Rrf2 family protein